MKQFAKLLSIGLLGGLNTSGWEQVKCSKVEVLVQEREQL